MKLIWSAEVIGVTLHVPLGRCKLGAKRHAMPVGSTHVVGAFGSARGKKTVPTVSKSLSGINAFRIAVPETCHFAVPFWPVELPPPSQLSFMLPDVSNTSSALPGFSIVLTELESV